jgi:hypothetical protein
MQPLTGNFLPVTCRPLVSELVLWSLYDIAYAICRVFNDRVNTPTIGETPWQLTNPARPLATVAAFFNK